MTFDDILKNNFKEDDEELVKAHQNWVAIGGTGATLMEYHILLTLALQKKVVNILELGPGAGASTETFMMAIRRKKSGNVTSVDIQPPEKSILVTDKTGLTQFTGNTNQFFVQNKNKWDLIFVDANHTSEQSRKDIENSVSVINSSGVVVCHDLLFGKLREKTDISGHIIDISRTYGKKYKLIEQFGNGMGLIY